MDIAVSENPTAGLPTSRLAAPEGLAHSPGFVQGPAPGGVSNEAGMMTSIRRRLDAGGIVVLTLDDPTAMANTVNDLYKASMAHTLDWLNAEVDQIRGVILTSAKRTFFAGGDLKRASRGRTRTRDEAFAHVEEVKSLTRRLETFARPVVAAIGGSALGGGMELVLGCHRRIVVTDPSIQLGFPEVGIGLIPGGGGLARAVRMLGVLPALELILGARRLTPVEALAAGLVDEVVATQDELLPAAHEWIRTLGGKAPRKVWDLPELHFPGGIPDWPTVAADLASSQKLGLGGPANPAVRGAIAAAVNGAATTFAEASVIESRQLADLASAPHCRAMIGVRFLDLKRARGDSHERGVVKSIGIVGQSAETGAFADLCSRSGLVVRTSGRVPAAGGSFYEEARALRELDQIADCNVVVADDGVDIRGLRTLVGSGRLAQLVGAHNGGVGDGLLSKAPVRLRMWQAEPDSVIEIIVDDWSVPQMAIWRSLCRRVGSIPLFVRPSEGLLIERLASTRLDEWAALVYEGIDPAQLGYLSRRAGYSVTGVELAELTHWRGSLQPPAHGHAHSSTSASDILERLILSEAVDAVRCLTDGLAPDFAINLAAVFGIGFPLATGGPLRYVAPTANGLEAMLRKLEGLAACYGDRFELRDSDVEVLKQYVGAQS